VSPEWQTLMRDWEETELRLRSLPAEASERPKLEQRLQTLKHSIDVLVGDRQKRRRPVAGHLTAVAIKPSR
jgi:hypothetical protein